MDETELLHEVTEFRAGILDGRAPMDMCFVICAPLSGYLSFIGYPCEMTEGNIDGVQHFWLVTADGTIIDPTADQFDKPDGKSMPSIYIGGRPTWYNREKVEFFDDEYDA